MIPNLSKGSGIKGTALYVLHDKRDADASLRRELAVQSSDRVGFTATRNLSTDNPDLAWRLMCQTAKQQDELKRAAGISTGGRRTEKFCAHLSLSWHPDEKPTPAEMLHAADSAIKAMGWEKLQALVVEHTDEKHKHVHIVVNLIDPETGRAAPNIRDDYAKVLQPWAYAYEQERGQILCADRAKKLEVDRAPATATPAQENKRTWLPRAEWEAQQRAARQAQGNAWRGDASERANDNDKATSIWERQKAARDEAYQRAKIEAKDKADAVRAAFKPSWSALGKQHYAQRAELQRTLQRGKRADLAAYVDRHQQTLLKAFAGMDAARAGWPALVKKNGLQDALTAAHRVETATLSAQQSAARHDQQRQFWDGYGKQVVALRQDQADERAAARVAQISRQNAARAAAGQDPRPVRPEDREAAQRWTQRDGERRAATLYSQDHYKPLVYTPPAAVAAPRPAPVVKAPPMAPTLTPKPPSFARYSVTIGKPPPAVAIPKDPTPERPKPREDAELEAYRARMEAAKAARLRHEAAMRELRALGRNRDRDRER